MSIFNSNTDLYMPDNCELSTALSRTTHMSIAAHQDDIEMMAYHGIEQCYKKNDQWFFGVVVTNGAGSPRNGIFTEYTDQMMMEIRKLEQRKAAFIGEYSGIAQLAHTSQAVKDPTNTELVEEIKNILLAAKPKNLYIHNLADKHDTHVAVALKTIAALRLLSAEDRPEKVYGCEVWRGLDWMDDQDKQYLEVGAYPSLFQALLGVFDSQIMGGKNYGHAATGRMTANATYANSHQTDTSCSLTYAMDLTPLILDPDLTIESFVLGHIHKLEKDISTRLKKLL